MVRRVLCLILHLKSLFDQELLSVVDFDLMLGLTRAILLVLLLLLRCNQIVHRFLCTRSLVQISQHFFACLLFWLRFWATLRCLACVRLQILFLWSNDHISWVLLGKSSSFGKGSWSRLSRAYFKWAIIEHQLIIHTSIDKSWVVVLYCGTRLIQLVCCHKDRLLNTTMSLFT